MLRPRFSPDHHTGRVRHRHETSYALLAFLLILTSVILLAAGQVTQAALGDPAENPQSGSVGLTGKKAGPPPSVAARIIEPTNGQRFTTIPITVRGTCSQDVIVAIYKNEVFAGSTPCDQNGGFSLLIDLFAGQNVLVAKVIDLLGQNGPDSNTVTIYYDPPATLGTFTDRFTKQLVLKSDTFWMGVSPGSDLTWPVEIIGGIRPYAVSWDWGDNKVDPISRPEAGPFEHKHIYSKAGNYRLILKASDTAGGQAYLQLTAVVNGAAAAPGSNIFGGRLAIAWPLLIVAVLLAISFYLGERWERRHERAQAPLPIPTPAPSSPTKA